LAREAPNRGLRVFHRLNDHPIPHRTERAARHGPPDPLFANYALRDARYAF